MPAKDSLQIVCAEDEGQKVEFKAALSGIAKEMAAFANASGGAAIADFLEVFPLSKATMNRRLNKLIEDGWVRSHGQGRSTFYTIDDALMTDETK